MPNQTSTPKVQDQPVLMIALGWFAIFGCVIFAGSIILAGIVVPEHDWIADTISDLGAGKYEFIVDIGLYVFSASLIAIALLSAHVHMGGAGWSAGIVGLAMLGLIVFLVGARNEYGDGDNEGVVIHIYLVYALGLLILLIPLLMAKGAGRAGSHYKTALIATSAVWAVCAPVFFFLPNDVDGLYERGLGLIAFALVITLSHLFIRRGKALR